nr:immunoglobulin light chain junction region [Mus musculus]NSM02214.1 immunoglobulin light chain junction region [Mus musculus]
CQHHYGTPRTF